jgi:hypothetical protein
VLTGHRTRATQTERPWSPGREDGIGRGQFSQDHDRATFSQLQALRYLRTGRLSMTQRRFLATTTVEKMERDNHSTRVSHVRLRTGSFVIFAPACQRLRIVDAERNRAHFLACWPRLMAACLDSGRPAGSSLPSCTVAGTSMVSRFWSISRSTVIACWQED